MLKKDAREPYKEIGVAQCFQGLRRFCFQTRDSTLSKMLSIKNTSIFLPFDTKNGQPPQYYLQKLPDSLRNYISSYFQEKPRLSLEVNNY